jgi:hypothetical protein
MKQIAAVVAATLLLTMLVSLSYAEPWRWRGNQKNTYGWQLMTPEERNEHQAKLRGFIEYEACKQYIDDHHNLMVQRAKEKGIAPPAMRRNPCDTMKAKGVLK